MKRLLAIFLIFVFSSVSVFADDQLHQEYLTKLEDYKNAPIIKPDENSFLGLKVIQKEEIEERYTKDGTIYDKNHNPINGVVVVESETSKQMLGTKNGKRDGYSAFWDKENGQKTLISDVYSQNGKIIRFQQFYPNGQLRNETNAEKDVILGRTFYSNGVLRSTSISYEKLDKKHAFFILKIYDKDGKLLVYLDTFDPPAWCYMNNGNKKQLNQNDIDILFHENDKMVLSTEELGIPFKCE